MEETLVLEKGSKDRSRNKVAADIMIPDKNYPIVYEEASIREAVSELMNSYDGYISNKRLIYTVHRSMLVVDSKGEFKGILSVRNLIRALTPGKEGDNCHESEFWSRVKDLSIRKVKDIMQKGLVKVSKNAGLIEVAQKMAAANTRRVVVVDEDGEVVGILREQELFFEMANIIL